MALRVWRFCGIKTFRQSMNLRSGLRLRYRTLLHPPQPQCARLLHGPSDSYWRFACSMNVRRALNPWEGDEATMAQLTQHPIEFRGIFHPSDFSEASRV